MEGCGARQWRRIPEADNYARRAVDPRATWFRSSERAGTLPLPPILDKKAEGHWVEDKLEYWGGGRKVETLDGGSSRQKLRHRRQFPSLSNRMNYTVAASSSLWTGRLDNRINENAPPPPPLPSLPSTPEFIRYYRYVLDNSTFIAGRWKSYLWAVCQYLIADRRFSRRASP